MVNGMISITIFLKKKKRKYKEYVLNVYSIYFLYKSRSYLAVLSLAMNDFVQLQNNTAASSKPSLRLYSRTTVTVTELYVQWLSGVYGLLCFSHGCFVKTNS